MRPKRESVRRGFASGSATAAIDEVFAGSEPSLRLERDGDRIPAQSDWK